MDTHTARLDEMDGLCVRHSVSVDSIDLKDLVAHLKSVTSKLSQNHSPANINSFIARAEYSN